MNFKNKLLSSTALIAIFLAVISFSRSASAADLVIEEPPVPPVVPQQYYSPFLWTGPYVGAHIGYSWGKSHDVSNGISENGPSEVGFDSLRFSGLTGGLHTGYNYQFSNSFVFGVEADIDYTSIDGSHHISLPDANDSLSMRLNWQGSTRLRAGYAVDRTLFYATGGLAFAGAQLRVRDSTDRNTHIGWTAGAGVEHAFTDKWIGRFEVRYSDFNKKTYDTPLGNLRLDFNQTSATVGISYKF